MIETIEYILVAASVKWIAGASTATTTVNYSNNSILRNRDKSGAPSRSNSLINIFISDNFPLTGNTNERLFSTTKVWSV